MGAALPGLDAVLLGAHPHWLTHSALPIFGMRKLSEKFDGYLRKQEELIAQGQLSEAERKRAEFERNITKYVGAPLLGAFSCAAGAAMFAQILQPGSVVGAPVSWLVGGNPFLGGVWLFANGVICFHEGYKFFMIALADQGRSCASGERDQRTPAGRRYRLTTAPTRGSNQPQIYTDGHRSDAVDL